MNPTAQQTRQLIDEILRVVLAGLVPCFQEIITEEHSSEEWSKVVENSRDGKRTAKNLDISGLCKVYFKKFEEDINKQIDGTSPISTFHDQMHQLRKTRNAWAHYEGFSLRDVLDAASMGQKLLRTVGATAQLTDLQEQERKIMRALVAEESGEEHRQPITTDHPQTDVPSLKATASSHNTPQVAQQFDSAAGHTHGAEQPQALVPPIQARGTIPRDTLPTPRNRLERESSHTTDERKRIHSAASSHESPESRQAPMAQPRSHTSASTLTLPEVSERAHPSNRNLFFSAKICDTQSAKERILLRVCSERPNWPGIVYVRDLCEAKRIAALLRSHSLDAGPIQVKDNTSPSAISEQQLPFLANRSRTAWRVSVAVHGRQVLPPSASARFAIHLVTPISLDLYAQDIIAAIRGHDEANCILLTTNDELDKLTRYATEIAIDIDNLRKVYQAIRDASKGRGDGNWAVLSPRSLSEIRENADIRNATDFEFALGVFERAQLIIHHHDTPASYSIRQAAGASAGNPKQITSDPYTKWFKALRLPATIDTTETCIQLDMPPSELDSRLGATPNILLA